MSKSSRDTGSPQRRPFETTCWSVVLRANGANTAESRQAIEQLCQQYWYPLFLFVRRRVGDFHEAQDLTQAFFSQLIANNRIAVAQQERGRFRTFLLTSIQNFMTNQWKKQAAQKRGGGQQLFSIDPGDEALSRPGSLASRDLTAEQLFERSYAIALLDQALMRVQEEYRRTGRERLFECLKPTIAVSSSLPAYAEIAERLEIPESNVKVAVHRIREKFRQQVRQVVAETVEDPAEIQDEILSLFQVFAN